MSFGPFETILCVLASALFVSVIFRKFQIPVIIGYLTVGALLGPHGLAVIPNTNLILELAEFGIVFLMFTVGLEFSISQLIALKKSVFIIGGLQVLLCILICTGIGTLLGMSTASALIVGSIVAMSSTAIVIKQLDDQFELYSASGLNAISILLFQDIAVIPIIILIASFATAQEQSISIVMLWAAIKGIVAIVLIGCIGRWLLRPLFHLIAKTHAIELFTLSVLLITLTSAWLTNSLGLSFSLGAFLAGMMLSETEFRHQIEIEIRPFRDILLGLFFITIGMLTNITLWSDIWPWISLLLFALTLAKMLLISSICRMTGNSDAVSFRTGLVLAQGGEFGFAILTLALSQKLLPPEYDQVILAALIISILLSPIIISFNQAIANLVLVKPKHADNDAVQEQIAHRAKNMKNHIIICGYGRVGQHIAKILKKINYPYIGLDIDPEIARKKHLKENILFGDATHPGILSAAGLDQAKAVIVSFAQLKPSKKVISIIKHLHPTLPILVRCKDQYELDELKKLQPSKIVAETFEESLTLSHFMLAIIGTPEPTITEIIDLARSNDYKLLRSTRHVKLDNDQTLV